MKNIALLSLVSLLLISCSPSKKEKVSLNGSWESSSYGSIICINDSIVKNYNHCSFNCFFDYEESRKGFDIKYEIINLTSDSLVLKNGITEYGFSRIDSLPQLMHPDSAKSPSYNFETLWHTFNDLYCYFDTRDIYWKKYYDTYSAKISYKTSKIDLFNIFNEMLGEMNDNHVYIELPEELDDEYSTSNPDKIEAEEKKYQLIEKAKQSILDKYVDQAKTYNHGMINWGKIEEKYLYIQINSMIAFADFEISKDLSSDDFWEKYWELANKSPNYTIDEMAGVKKIMDSILGESAQTEEIILDIRFNDGGWDQVALEFLSNLTDKETMVFTKKARLGKGFTVKQQIKVLPSDSPSTKQVFLLTSYLTESAAEIMALSALELENLTIIGSPTEGIFSDVLSKKLPNGWYYGLSNEIYESPEGFNYENLGIPPDHKLKYKKDDSSFCKYLIDNMEKGDEAIELILNKKL